MQFSVFNSVLNILKLEGGVGWKGWKGGFGGGGWLKGCFSWGQWVWSWAVGWRGLAGGNNWGLEGCWVEVGWLEGGCWLEGALAEGCFGGVLAG